MFAQTHTFEYFEPAIDWLTLATYKFEAYANMIAFLKGLDTSTKWRTARWLQYDGASDNTGIFYGHAVQTNDREHYIIRISGSRSQRVFDDMMIFTTPDLMEQFYATRVDIQLTRKIPDAWFPRQCYDDILSKGLTASLVQSKTGNTLYVGKRTSGRFMRIYEKMLETLHLRLEFELKEQYARQAWDYLITETMTPGQIYADMLSMAKLPSYMDAWFHVQDEPGGDYAKHVAKVEASAQLKWLLTLLPKFQSMTNDHDIGMRVRDIFYALSTYSIDNPQDRI